MLHTMRWLLILVGVILTTVVSAQPPNPAPPAKFKVTLRYYIPAPRDPHVVAYDGMINHLKKLDFEFTPPLDQHPKTDREDRGKNYIHGFIVPGKTPNWIPPGKALKLLEPAVVQSLLLVPDGFELPDPVLVRLELAGNLPADRQRELANQTRVLLKELGFKEPVGYDHRGYTKRPQTRIVGSIPRGKLDLLQRDLRNHPAGWLAPIIQRNELPIPLRDVNPIQVIEVLPDAEPLKEVAEPEPRGEGFLDKISTDLWELVNDKDAGSKRVRIQIGFVGHIAPDDDAWKGMLHDTVPGFFVEGQLGQFVTGIIRLDQVKRLAAAPMVNVIRLPFVTHVNVSPDVKIKGDNEKALELTKLKELRQRGYLGQGVRVGIIDRDFRGWEALVKKKLLPRRTRLVDLTTELDPEIYPKKHAGDPDEPGHGTLCAQATALAAPEAEIVLIRVETIDPFHMQEIVRYVQGGDFSPQLNQRDGELLARAGELRLRRNELLEERRAILNDFTDDTDQKAFLSFLGEFYTWLYSDRDWHFKRMEVHEKIEAEHIKKQERYRTHLKSVSSLEGIGILVNALSWNSGYPLGSISPLTKFLDDPKGPLWFQAVGNTRGQTWIGRLRQTPGDPAMKFDDDSLPLPRGRWSNEINFLNWQPYQGEGKLDFPDKVRLRLTLQWREPHDPDYFQLGDDDLYRIPLAEMRLTLLRQRDPEAKAIPADIFDLMGRTTGWPNRVVPGSASEQPPRPRIVRAPGGAQRIEHLPTSSVYEHVLEVPLEKGGRYAVRIEKLASTQWMFVPHPERKSPMFHLVKDLTTTGIRPLHMPTLESLEKHWDLRPRLFVEVIDDANRVQGRAVFADFWTDAASIGVPADGRNVISVGAASFKNQPQPYSAFGSPAGVELAPPVAVRVRRTRPRRRRRVWQQRRQRFRGRYGRGNAERRESDARASRADAA